MTKPLDHQNAPISDHKPEISFVQRPWGNFSQYAHNQPVTVSFMTINPHSRLSLQAHSRRSELWIVIDLGAVIQVDEKIFHPNPGDEIWIPAGSKHRLSSTVSSCRVLEVAFGDWQQDDITRFDDDYDRPAQGE
jgi:mannose-6-phosphate isomerase